MSDIFISYAKDDRAKAKKLATALETIGWSVFWDRTIPIGKTWDSVIESELSAARAMVVLWSDKSVSSEWVRAEAGEAADRGILLPAQIQKNIEIPLRFRSMQAADLSEWYGATEAPAFQELVDAIKTKLGSAPVVEEEPVAVDVEAAQETEKEIQPPPEIEEKEKPEPPPTPETGEKIGFGKLAARWNTLPAKSKKILAASCVAILVTIIAVPLVEYLKEPETIEPETVRLSGPDYDKTNGNVKIELSKEK